MCYTYLIINIEKLHCYPRETFIYFNYLKFYTQYTKRSFNRNIKSKIHTIHALGRGTKLRTSTKNAYILYQFIN